MYRAGLLALLLALVLGCAPLFAQATAPPPVLLWKQAVPAVRQSYVAGYREGRGAMAQFYYLLRDTAAKGTPDESALVRSLSARQRELLGKVYAAEWKRESLHGLDPATLEAAVTDLYLDPANGLVGWGPMLQLAVGRLRGTPWDEIERSLAGLRRAALESQ